MKTSASEVKSGSASVGGGEGLRIAHVQPLSLDLFGHNDTDFGTGAKYFLTHIAAAQRRGGDEPTVHLLTTGEPKRLQVRNVDVYFHQCVQPPAWLGVQRRFARQISPSMVAAIRSGSADIVHFHGCRSIQVMYALVAWRAHREGLPLVAQDHGPRSVGPFVGALQSYAYRHTARFLAANAGSRMELQARGISSSRIVRIPNGVDSRTFHPSRELRERPHDPFRVLAVFRLWPDKDPMTVVEGLRRLAAGTSVQLTHVGGGPMESEFCRAVEEASIPGEFLGRLSQEELAKLYRRSNALVLSSLREGFNQVTIEAMASGLPVVATNVDGIRDGVGGAGILFEPGDADALSGALRKLIESPDEWRRYRAAGLQRSKRFRWDPIAARLHEVYLEALGQTPTET